MRVESLNAAFIIFHFAFSTDPTQFQRSAPFPSVFSSTVDLYVCNRTTFCHILSFTLSNFLKLYKINIYKLYILKITLWFCKFI